MRIPIQATRNEIDTVLIPFAKAKMNGALDGLKGVRLNKPLDLSVQYALDDVRTVEVGLTVEEVDGAPSTAGFQAHP